MKLDPECYKPNAIFFLRPNGIYLPCCYSSTTNFFEEYLGDLYYQLDLNKYSLEEIKQSEAWKKLREMIESDDPIVPCKDFCVKQRDESKDLAGNIRSSIIV